MKKSGVLGPVAGHPARATHLTSQQDAVLDALSRLPRPAAIPQIAAALGLHPNTTREHLDALVDKGLVERRRAPATGRGRPAWHYEPAPSAVLEPAAGEYAGLASALARHIARTSPDPVREALAAGRAWGADLAAAFLGGAPATTGMQGRRRLVALLERLGFDPEADREAGTVKLRRCPLLEAARQEPEVVCSVHLGILEGALEASGASAIRPVLQPFAEPGACRLTLLEAHTS